MAKCLCSHEEQSLGRLYGISMGRGQVRTTTRPDCPVHGRCGACGVEEGACYKQRWAKGVKKMLRPCCAQCTHVTADDNEEKAHE